MTRSGLAVLAAVLCAGMAQAAGPSPSEIVSRHMAAAGKGDVDAIVADYADDAVVMQANEVTQGKANIHALFQRLFGGRANAPAGSGAPAMNVTRVWEEGDVGIVTWEAGPVKGRDEFLVQGGKIKVQAVFLSGAPAAQ